jgi:hypothetical protein
MSREARRGKLTILWLMVAIAALAVVLRGLMETPRVVRFSLWDGIADSYARRAVEDETRGDGASADWNRRSADRYAKLARPHRPDPIGRACYVVSLHGVPVVLGVVAAGHWSHRRARRLRDGDGPPPVGGRVTWRRFRPW